MDEQQIVVVTGVSSFWGEQVAVKLLANASLHVIGIDIEKPAAPIAKLDFIQADIRNPLLVDLLKSEQVKAVCHLRFEESLRPSETSFDINVNGTINLLGACAEAGVQKIILKSSTMVYGALSDNPGFLVEDYPLRGSRKYGYTRDYVEIESFCNGFRRQNPQILLTILRFPSIIGPNTSTPMTQFLADPLAPVLLGFDPMFQFIHEKDVIGAIQYAFENDYPGIFNVAAEGILPLMRVLGITGKLPLPVIHFLPYLSLGALGTRTQKHFPIEPDYLRYRWIANLQRMSEELGFIPSYTAEEALREFAGELRKRQYIETQDDMSYDTERLRDTIERRRRSRELLEAHPELQYLDPGNQL